MYDTEDSGRPVSGDRELHNSPWQVSGYSVPGSNALEVMARFKTSHLERVRGAGQGRGQERV